MVVVVAAIVVVLLLLVVVVVVVVVKKKKNSVAAVVAARLLPRARNLFSFPSFFFARSRRSTSFFPVVPPLAFGAVFPSAHFSSTKRTTRKQTPSLSVSSSALEFAPTATPDEAISTRPTTTSKSSFKYVVVESSRL